jgi:glucosamine--fructose-6-phosphate aminotransferase (isomerizing)
MNTDPTNAPAKTPGQLSRAAFAQAEESMLETTLAGAEFFADLAGRVRSGEYENVVITGEGSSYTAELMCAAALKRSVPVKTDIVLTTELPFWTHLLGPKTLVLALSRTGERRFILDALEGIKPSGAHVVALCGNPQARVNELADEVFLTREGPEPGFLKSKSTLAGVAALLTFAACFDQPGEPSSLGLTLDHVKRLAACVGEGFTAMAGAGDLLPDATAVEHWAVGAAGYCFGTAVDGALKLHEITTVAATPYHLTSLYHGPLGQLGPKWGAVIASTRGTREWAELLATEILGVGGGPVVYLGAGDLEAPDERMVSLPVASLFPAGGGEDPSLSEVLAPATFLPAVYTMTLEFSLARGLDPDTPPNMDYMLKLILPDGQSEPDLVSQV